VLISGKRILLGSFADTFIYFKVSVDALRPSERMRGRRNGGSMFSPERDILEDAVRLEARRVVRFRKDKCGPC
jgi:hypothetical protein